MDMYTMEANSEDPTRWDILDPDGDVIFTVNTEGEAEAALSHLNR
jgi:hypothetical protein